MFGAIKSWFSGLSGATKQEIRDEINILEAIQKHLSWRTRLLDYVNGASDEQLDPKVICRDDQCPLGKWIHGPAHIHFNDSQGFVALREKHAQFHVIAAEVVNFVHASDRARARLLLEGKFHIASHDVVTSLTALNNELAE